MFVTVLEMDSTKIMNANSVCLWEGLIHKSKPMALLAPPLLVVVLLKFSTLLVL